MVRIFNICSIFLFLISSFVFGQNLYNNFPVTNGAVNAIVQSGNNIYIGGQFTSVGPNTGRGTVIDPSTGLLIPGFPDVNGTIYKVVSDDAGGWYIGGTFIMLVVMRGIVLLISNLTRQSIPGIPISTMA